MMATFRFAPMKGSTIPRLDQAQSLETVRLYKILRKELGIELRPTGKAPQPAITMILL